MKELPVIGADVFDLGGHVETKGETHVTIEEATAIVRNANRLPQVDDIWLTRDGKNKVLVISKDTRSMFGRVIKGSYSSPVAQLCFDHDGEYSAGNQDMDLVAYITTI